MRLCFAIAVVVMGKVEVGCAVPELLHEYKPKGTRGAMVGKGGVRHQSFFLGKIK
jgi:hypothetical protein